MVWAWCVLCMDSFPSEKKLILTLEEFVKSHSEQTAFDRIKCQGLGKDFLIFYMVDKMR